MNRTWVAGALTAAALAAPLAAWWYAGSRAVNYQRRQLEGPGQAEEVGQLGVVQGGNDQQHGVGAHEPGIAHV